MKAELNWDKQEESGKYSVSVFITENKRLVVKSKDRQIQADTGRERQEQSDTGRDKQGQTWTVSNNQELAVSILSLSVPASTWFSLELPAYTYFVIAINHIESKHIHDFYFVTKLPK